LVPEDRGRARARIVLDYTDGKDRIDGPVKTSY
jgi:hypothetical protein